ncbi:MAG: glycoside hydrolase family 3 protein [Oscillospiraceae bacterium]|jgi:beta-glucosidase-like glycosyl hydrolase|nr:glycoside hydrolase family 3 protein [Oscillospiraceae bacterium]
MFKKIISMFVSSLLFLNLWVNFANAKNLEQMSIEEKIGQIICLELDTWSNETQRNLQNSGSIRTSVIKAIISKKSINEIILFVKKIVNQEKAEKLIADLQTAINQNNEFISISKIFDENSISTEQSKKIICRLQQIISQNSFVPLTEINDEVKEVIEKYHIGGVNLLNKNFENKEQAKKLINDFQKAAICSGNPPLLVCADQEGGRVEKFAFDREKLKENAEIKTPEEAFQKGETIGKELKEIGINCNFAPVVDINSNPKNPIINTCSFADNAEVVSEFGKKFMEGLHSQNIISTAKHFPGHGDTNLDSHLELPIVNKNLNELEALELIPFQAMIDAGVDMIMIAHIEFPKIENKTFVSKKDGKEFCLPATVSHFILTDLLRNKMGFNGVIITDAMNMKAISENIGEAEAVKMAIQAGADIVLMPAYLRSKSDTAKLDQIYNVLKEALENNEISEKQLDESVKRILKLKDKYCNNLKQEIETPK